MKHSCKLKHLAIIPDGNRRWAKKRNLPPFKGHKKGMERFEEIARELSELKVFYATFWIASRDNLVKRSKTEVNFLYQLFTRNFKRLAKEEFIHKNQVRVRVLGDWEKMVPKNLKKAIYEVSQKTSHYKKFNLTFLLAYNGINDMIQAVKKVAKRKPPKISYAIIKKHLSTSELPPVDLVIRTGGKPHNSAGFMMWQTAYSQYYFTPIFYPAFGKKELRKAIDDYCKRKRRFGA